MTGTASRFETEAQRRARRVDANLDSAWIVINCLGLTLGVGLGLKLGEWLYGLLAGWL